MEEKRVRPLPLAWCADVPTAHALFFFFSRYAPSVFLLTAGQSLHIPKGCLHAFRKSSSCILPEGDCHRLLREGYISANGKKVDEACISFAWDWIWLGNSVSQVMEELHYLTEMKSCNRARKSGPLSVFEFSLFRLATILTETPNKYKNKDISSKDMAAGILPTVKGLIGREIAAHKEGVKLSDGNESVVVASCIDTPQMMEKTEYCCTMCWVEIPNYYWRRLTKDVNSDTVCCYMCAKPNAQDNNVTYKLHYRFRDAMQLEELLKSLEKMAAGMKQV